MVKTISVSYDHFLLGFPGDTSGKEPTCQCRRHRFDPWVGRIPWRRTWQPTPVFLPGGNPMDRGACLAAAQGVIELDMTYIHLMMY